nr:MAG TPA: hypothetical protein [Caudoviricetes sp.]DAJ95456.1 MAG TPA: hypothetical protein [Caudoviricetes sp.]
MNHIYQGIHLYHLQLVRLGNLRLVPLYSTLLVSRKFPMISKV